MLLVLLCSCSAADRQEVSVGTIDRSYMESERYQKFSRKAQQERERTAEERKQLAAFVQQQLAGNAYQSSLSLPAVIDTSMIRLSLKDQPVKRSSLTTLLGYKQVYHPLAKAKARGMAYHFFMTCKVASYSDCLVWFASLQEGELQAVEMITTYLKTLVYSEIPTIRVSDDAIEIEVKRNVEYPLANAGRFYLQYSITDKGHIRRAIQ